MNTFFRQKLTNKTVSYTHLFFTLRRIAKKQTRHPLFFNFAISGYGNRLTIEKIHIEG